MKIKERLSESWANEIQSLDIVVEDDDHAEEEQVLDEEGEDGNEEDEEDAKATPSYDSIGPALSDDTPIHMEPV